MRKLEGGFINQVYLDGEMVVKVFDNDRLVGIPSSERLLNESTALHIFGGDIAPKFIKAEPAVLYQEFIDGESYEVRARRGERVFEEAGRLLRRIHEFCPKRATRVFQFRDRFQKASSAARRILEHESLEVHFQISGDDIERWGIRYTHRDFWLGNILGHSRRSPKAIDWEFSGPSSPYDDFAIVDLWVFREFPGSEPEFWAGYGDIPDRRVILEFLKLRCVEFLATTTFDSYVLEESSGFYHNKVSVLKSISEADQH